MFKHQSISLKTVLIYSLMLNAGASFIWPLITMYINKDLHQSLITAGMVSLFLSIFMMAGNYLGGYLFDNWSAYKTSIISVSISTLAIIALIFFHGWPMFAILLMFVGFGDGANLTLMNSYATMISHHSSRYTFNIMYIGINLGLVVGTAMVGFLFKFGIATVFIVAGLFYLMILIMTVLFFNVNFKHLEAVKRQKDTKLANSQATKPRHNSILLIIAVLAMAFSIYLAYSIWGSVMSVYMTDLKISFVKYSWIWVVNGILIAVGQAFVNHLFRKMNIALQVIIGVLIFSSSFLLLMITHTYLGFALNIAWLTIGEMISLPNIPAWIDNFARIGQKGRYQAYFNTLMTAGRAVGPLFDGLIVDYLSYQFLFGTAGILVIALTALVGLASYNYYRK